MTWLATLEYYFTYSVEEVARVRIVLAEISNNKQSIPIKAGFVVEQLHALSYNLMAASEAAIREAHTDRSECFYEFGFRKNDSHDIVVAGESDMALSQVKYYSSAERTEAGLRQLRYNGMLPIVPAEQVAGVQQAARRTALRRGETALGHMATHVERNTSSSLFFAGICSTEVSRDLALEVAQNPDGAAFWNYVRPFLEWQIYRLLQHRLSADIQHPSILFSCIANPAHEWHDIEQSNSLNVVRDFCTKIAQQYYPQILAQHLEYEKPISDGLLF